MKTCSTCKTEKSLDSFSKRASSKDGRQSRCKDCVEEYNSEYYQKNSDKIKQRTAPRRDEQKSLLKQKIVEHLLANPCIDCGEIDIVVLEFDHVTGDKSYNISDMVRMGMSLKLFYKEVEKCVVRCANCHKRKTAKDQHWSKANF